MARQSPSLSEWLWDVPQQKPNDTLDGSRLYSVYSEYCVIREGLTVALICVFRCVMSEIEHSKAQKGFAAYREVNELFLSNWALFVGASTVLSVSNAPKCDEGSGT